MYWGINCKCFVSRSVSCYIVHALHLCSLGQDITPDDTWPFWLKKSIFHRNAVMETKLSDFSVSKTIKYDHCSKLFQRTKIYSFQNFQP